MVPRMRPRKLQNNEILAFDTDLVGIYGYCIDISRTWWIGDDKPRQDMIDAYKHAVEHIRTNEQLIKPGVSMKELTFGGHQLDPKYVARQYSCRFHGVGLCESGLTFHTKKTLLMVRMTMCLSQVCACALKRWSVKRTGTSASSLKTS